MRLLTYFTVLISAALFVGCGSGIEGEKAKTGEAGKASKPSVQAVNYVVDVAASSVGWTGAKANGTHTGTINLKNGKLSAEGNKLTAGKFTIDMTSIIVTDLEGEWKEKLENHLKGTRDEGEEDHFFNTVKFPEADFAISSVVSNDDGTASITGNLTLKGNTKSITFPANVNIADGVLKASAPSFKINRTEWGINYNSEEMLGGAKDGLIYDDIGLTIALVANAQ